MKQKHEEMAPATTAVMEETLLDQIVGEHALRQQKQLSAAYLTVSDALLSKDDIHVTNEIDKTTGKPREYKKKSAWRKMARHFRISWSIDMVEGSWAFDPGGGLKHYNARALVTARAPWGQSVQEFGGCSTEEARFYFREGQPNKTARQKAQHDCEATAVTRAINRAISDLIAGGEVSAEEVTNMGSGDHAERAANGNGDGDGATMLATPARIAYYKRLLQYKEVPARGRESALQQLETDPRALGLDFIDARIAEVEAIITKKGGTVPPAFVTEEEADQDTLDLGGES